MVNSLVLIMLMSCGVVSTKSQDYYKGYASAIICEQEVVAMRTIIFKKRLPLPKPEPKVPDDTTGQTIGDELPPPVKAPTGPIEAPKCEPANCEKCKTGCSLAPKVEIPEVKKESGKPVIPPEDIAVIPKREVVPEVKLEEAQPSNVLTRLDGPEWAGPHGNCMMCLGNHLMSSHDVTRDYLDTIGYDQWQILHDNFHNDPAKAAEVTAQSGGCRNGRCGTGQYYQNYNTRPVLFPNLQRWFGR